MQKAETLSYEERYADATVSFSPFALANTGIQKAQTTLKIDQYRFSVVPWQFGLKRGILAGPLSRDEIVFFQRYKGAVAGLALVIQRPQSRDALKIFCRCQLATIGMMKDRDGIGLIVLDWKPIPPDLVTILGEHLDLLERLKLEWASFKDRSIPISPASARKLGFNNYAVMTANGEQHKLALFSLAANRLDFLMPLRSPDMRPGGEASFTLFFLKYRFSVTGTIESSERLPTGVQRVRASLAYSPELAHILEEYFGPESA